MKKEDNSIFEKNYSDVEYYERHSDAEYDNRPKQEPLEWHMWKDLVGFFKGYFNHFGDDISKLDDETFTRMVKTIWRFSNVVSFREGMKFQKEMTPSYMDQLKQNIIDIQRHNLNEPDEYYSPQAFFRDVLNMSEK